MRFLVDHDVYKMTSDLLKQWGHDVVLIKDIEMHRALDRDLLLLARETSRLLLTRDKDFGALVFLEGTYSTGVILLRMNPLSTEEVHNELLRLLQKYREDELQRLFCVVEARRFRLRRLPPQS